MRYGGRLGLYAKSHVTSATSEIIFRFHVNFLSVTSPGCELPVSSIKPEPGGHSRHRNVCGLTVRGFKGPLSPHTAKKSATMWQHSLRKYFYPYFQGFPTTCLRTLLARIIMGFIHSFTMIHNQNF